MRTEAELQAQRQLVADLRASDLRDAHAQADALQARHYEEQMGLVSEDVYESARGGGEPPVGWVRGSENLDLLRQHMPELAGMPDDLIRDMLKPDDSGFRAEIYLPDAAVLGPGYKPTVVFKGSNGEVLQADGTRRETGAEDFGANNFPQAIGLKTDYYDRAMDLANMLKRYGVSVDYAGHSLGGGLASAAVAVSGERGTTFNAAGLHPDTARRFQQENPDVRLYDPQARITAYQVRGEVLTDGLQNNVERMDVAQRRVLGAVLKETADLVQDVPQLKQAVTRQLQSTDMPVHARASVARFVDALADGDADRMLRDLPLSAGQVRTLDARAWQDGRLVQRPAEMPLDQVLALAGPALRAVRDVQAGAHLGHEAGEIVQGAGGIAQRTLDASGDAVRAGGVHTAQAASTVSEGITWVSCTTGDALSEVSAKARVAAGAVEARAEELQADITTTATAARGVFWQGVANLAPGGSALERFADVRVDQTIADNLEARDAAEADARAARQEAIRDAAAIRAAAADVCKLMETVHVTVDRTRRNAIAGATAQVDDALDEAGRQVKAVTDHAPAAGAVLGGTVATHASLNPIVNPAAAPNLAELARTLPQLSRHASAAAVEATERHLMASTVLPSLKADTDAMERESRQWLEEAKAPPQGSRGPFQDPHLNQAHAALMAGDGERLDRIALDFARSAVGQRLLQWSDALDRQTPSIALPDMHEQRAHAAQDMALSR
ncbi:phospholipase [Pseudoxanthomonas sp.]|uniref:phospholipase n=1 Tax=Pseudoxanthomonas sp. TaxID=1871049 RepID=UPI0028C3C77F|nr:phospholipase [Pseudoxanthomonas sp.]